MPTTGKKPQFFRIKRYLPQNRVQQRRIGSDPLEYRPIRMMRRDVVIKNLLKKAQVWFKLHRRFIKGRKILKTATDIQEERAIPEYLVKGTLPERIVYLELVKRHFVPGIDFDFQSSIEGGRAEFGGLVADFVLEKYRLIINPLGPFHFSTIGHARDREQESILASLGFTVIFLELFIIESPFLLEQWFRQYIDPGFVSIIDESMFLVEEFT